MELNYCDVHDKLKSCEGCGAYNVCWEDEMFCYAYKTDMECPGCDREYTSNDLCKYGYLEYKGEC